MARILALDYGKKRTGIAVTDMLQISINPIPTLLTKDLYEYLKKYLRESEVEVIVIGDPTHADGTPTYLAKDIKKLSNFLLREFPDTELIFIDEAYTSKDARNIMIQMGVKKKERMKKENIDKGSAILILKSYLDQKYMI